MGIISEKRIVQGAKLIQECGCCWNRVYQSIKKDEDKVTQALHTVGLESLRNRRIGELSGGELQRVFIAKALVKDPLLLILDEPVASVDIESQIKFYNVIKTINEQNNITIIWSSHDLDAISKYLQNNELKLKIIVGKGLFSETVWGCDLTKEYVDINAFYTT